MSTLHTLNKTAQATSLNAKLSHLIDKDDNVLLIEDGVYQCLTLSRTPVPKNEVSTWAHQAKKIYAIKEDALARGINIQMKDIAFISYEEFVKLSMESNKVVSWY